MRSLFCLLTALLLTAALLCYGGWRLYAEAEEGKRRQKQNGVDEAEAEFRNQR